VTPADWLFGHYVLLWGEEIFPGEQPDTRLVIRDLGRHSSGLLIADLPQAIVVAAEDELNRLVHDFQNSLLNLQLRHEVLERLTTSVGPLPEITLPSRAWAPLERLEEAARVLDRWAEFDLTLLDRPPTHVS
jgi:hypothetical protein